MNWTGLGSQWRFLPTSRRGEVERELDRIENIEHGIAIGLQAQAQRQAKVNQTAMPWGAN